MKFKGTEKKWEMYKPEHIGSTNVRFGSEELDGYIELWHHHSTVQKQKANALLISKSPEMLQMLIDAVSEYKSGTVVSDGWYKAVEQLIKQATEL